MRNHRPEHTHVQSRLCLTLCNREEIYHPIARGVDLKSIGSDNAPSVESHAGLFGPCAIGFDPVTARRLGIVPTTYYSPTDIFGDRYSASQPSVAGLGLQIIRRLKEIRDVLIVLAKIESSLDGDECGWRGEQALASLGLNLPYQPEITEALKALSPKERNCIYSIFDTDREPALNMVSFVEMMLSLYQETDSSIDGTPLAFFQQREWRLVHHMRVGMDWYCLGPQPAFRRGLSDERRWEIDRVRAVLMSGTQKPYDEGYFANCWLLEAVDGQHVANYIAEVVVPHRLLHHFASIAANAGISPMFIAAEDCGYR